MTRVAPYAQQELILFHTLRQQARLLDQQVQLSTDKVAQRYSGIAQEASRLVSTEAALGRVQQYIHNIDTVERRLSLMDLSMGTIHDHARELRATLNSTLDGPESHQAELIDFATNLRALVQEALNAHDGSRYLFAGARVDQPPVSFAGSSYTPIRLIESNGVTVDSTFYESYHRDVLGNPSFTEPSFYEQIYMDKNGAAPTPALMPADPDNPTLAEFVAEDPDLWTYYVSRMSSTEMLNNPKLDYYRGDDFEHSVRADKDLQVGYGLRANELTFQQLMLAIDAIANMPQSAIVTSEGQEIIREARDILENVLSFTSSTPMDSLTELRARLNSPRVTIADVRDRHQQFRVYADGVINGIENIDRIEVVARLQSDQVQLEASYAAISRLQSLSLLNFLR
ncbi:MAG: hypothetical protein ACE5Q3_05280 [Alphaproteobacteria bacterium]